jgi:catechol 2,3-dioxygenase-like lactoylglutathione lyase family enzyme
VSRAGRGGAKIWYRVRDLDAAGAFYVDKLGFEEVYRDEKDRWIRLARGDAEVALAEGDTGGDAAEPVLTVAVDDVKADAQRLREAGVDVGVVFEITGTIRLLDVFDPDGNRIQLNEDLEDR